MCQYDTFLQILLICDSKTTTQQLLLAGSAPAAQHKWHSRAAGTPVSRGPPSVLSGNSRRLRVHPCAAPREPPSGTRSGPPGRPPSSHIRTCRRQLGGPSQLCPGIPNQVPDHVLLGPSGEGPLVLAQQVSHGLDRRERLPVIRLRRILPLHAVAVGVARQHLARRARACSAAGRRSSS